MKAFAKSLQAQLVTWFTDNQNVVSIFNCGSKLKYQHYRIWQWTSTKSCLLNGVSIDMQCIPRDLNSAADDISKFIDYTINDIVFNDLDDLWGLHTCDRFACLYDANVQCFNSRFYQHR